MRDASQVVENFVRFYEQASPPKACPRCDAPRVVRDGSGARTASVMRQGAVVHVADVPLRRVRCQACQARWRIYPPGIVPHRHYQLCVVADAATQALFDEHSSQTATAARIGCHRRTVGRWLAWLAGLATAADLQARLTECLDAPLLAPTRATATCSRSPARGAIVALAGVVLVLIETLAHALKLEPPGLRSLVEHVVAGRPNLTTYARPAIPEFAHIRLGGRWPIPAG
jgi:hypothetical protein